MEILKHICVHTQYAEHKYDGERLMVKTYQCDMIVSHLPLLLGEQCSLKAQHFRDVQAVFTE